MFISWKDTNGCERAINLNAVSKMVFTQRDDASDDSERTCLEIEENGECQGKFTRIEGAQAETIWRQLMMTPDFV